MLNPLTLIAHIYRQSFKRDQSFFAYEQKCEISDKIVISSSKREEGCLIG